MAKIPKDFKKRILLLIMDDPISVSELSRKLNVRREFVSGYLEAMRQDGIVKVVEVGRSKVYKPK
ncbi:MAG: helix-turn-helix domain-containing protein [Planctomycetota bacterium]|jgi:DNA-binding transcriptional ArsR family regulator